jgi:DNA-directed RNA polymerase subunit RPC12/RpoP
VIKFHCKNCGQKINAPEIHAGKKGKCPKCKQTVLIPHIEPTAPLIANEHTGEPKVSPETSPFDPTLLDLPQARAQSPPAEYDVRSETAEDKLEQQLQEKIEQSENVGKRNLPWIIDIFLYPISTPGLITLGIIIIIPLLINIVAALLGPFATAIALPGFIINSVIGLYLYWYLTECVRDSAAGGLRAPETLGRAPGIGDMFLQLLKIIGCFVLCLVPLLIYYQQTKRTDVIFWLLLAYATFFFPMALLAVVMFDSFSGLNPILILRSIFRTFFPYCAMVVVFLFDPFLIAIIRSAATQSWVLSFLIRCIHLYLVLVAAHLLGRFYWRYQDKLKWDM